MSSLPIVFSFIFTSWSILLQVLKLDPYSVSFPTSRKCQISDHELQTEKLLRLYGLTGNIELLSIEINSIFQSSPILKCLPVTSIFSRPCKVWSRPVPSHLIGKYPPTLSRTHFRETQPDSTNTPFRLPETQFSGNGCDEQQKFLPGRMFHLHCGNWLGSIAQLVSGGSERV